jgi:putative ABC transport system permease protein
LTLRRISISNVKGMGRKYAAFFASSVLAVLVFYLLASFVMHPDVVNGYVSQAERVRQGLLISQYIIVIFTFFFVLYSSSAFIRARKKEFGLLTLLGATKAQMSRMIVTEHILIGLSGVAVGLGLGVPLSKLMLNAMSKMLGVTSPIRFIVVIPAVLWTSGLFLLLFVFIGTITTLQISPRKVVRLLREHQRPKVFPRYSRWVAIISLLLIGGGCGTAWFVDGRTLVPAMLPVTAVVSLGTFLFFAQASVGILMYLKKKTTFLYRNLNLLTISDLIFRMKENARVLAAVAVLSACVITATGTIYTAEATFLQDVARAHPQALTFAARGETAPETIASRVREILREDSIEVTEEIVLEGLVTPSQAENGTLLIPETNFNKWAEFSGAQRLSLEENEAAYLVPMVGEPNGETVPMEVVYGGETYTINTRTWPFPRTNYLSSMNRLMVVDDTLFESLAKGAADGDLAVFAGYEFDNWRDSLDAIKRIRSFLEAEHLLGLRSRVESYEGRKQMTALTAMIGLFVTVLFFIASGSMLYFRLFSEIEEDREKYGIMEKLGVSRHDIGTVVSRQLLVFFFAPIAVGSVHCGFAMKSLSNVLRMMHWPFLGVFRFALAAIAGFSVIQVVYFLAARRAYIREVFREAAA